MNRTHTFDVPAGHSTAIGRRQFCSSVGSLTAGALLISFGGGCGAAARTVEDDGAGILPRHAKAILRHASLAPSSHNVQPWQVNIQDERHWVVSLDPMRTLPAVDPDGREMLLSLGAFVENLVQSAAAHGYHADVSVSSPAASKQSRVAVRLSEGARLEPSEGEAGDAVRRIEDRRTIRDGLQSTPLSGSTVRQLLEPFGDNALYLAGESAEAAAIREGTIEAFRRQTYRDEAQQELAEWIRFSNGDAERHRDGLTTATMNLTGIAGWYVRHFMDASDVTTESFRDRGIDRTAQQASEGAGWIVASAPDDGDAELIEAGRQFQRFALSSVGLRIGVHPMSQMLEEAPWRDEVQQQFAVSGPVQFIVRVGAVEEYPDPVSLRRPPQWFATRA